MAQAPVFEVAASNFQDGVLERSRSTPILLDFWASWCGPCRTLTPVLEKLANDYGGSFALGKVNTEVEEELAYAFQVRSIPFVVLFANGRPVDAFSGALPEPEVVRFLERHGIRPAGEAAPVVEPGSPQSLLSEARAAILAGDLERGRKALAGIPAGCEQAEIRDRLQQGLQWLVALPAPAGGEASRALEAAREALRRGDLDAAIGEVLTSVGVDRAYQDGLARRVMLFLTDLLPDQDERRDEALRRLATLLY